MRRAVRIVAVAGILAAGFVVTSQALALAAPCSETFARRVILKTSDGVSVAAFMQGSGSLGVVLLPQSGADHCGWRNEAEQLGKGAMVLSLDFRGLGSSSEARGKELDFMKDVTVAVAALRERGAKSVVLVGASSGANEAVHAGSLITPAVDAVVAVSGSFDGRLKSDAATLGMPVWALVAEAKTDAAGVAAADSEALIGAATRSTDAKFVRLPGNEHGWDLVRPGTKAHDVLVEFLKRFGYGTKVGGPS
jgi:alpha-beta hydrolase superfamily lysophospholipase